MSLYCQENFKLDDRSREIAKELGEDPAQKLSQLDVLKSWVLSHNYLHFRTDDEFLLRFLRVGKFSCEAAKERITHLCIARSSKLDGLPDWFEKQTMKDPKIREVLETGMIYLMPKTDDLGRMVVIFEIEKMKQVKMSPLDFCRATYLFMDWVVFNFERSQINGMVFVEVGGSIDMEFLTYWTPDRMKKSLGLMQGGLPVRMKRVEYYNMPAVLKVFIDSAFALMKPKMQKRVKFHSDNKAADDIPSHCMPACLGGDGPEWQHIKGDLLQALDDFQAEFDALKMCRVDDAKRPKQYIEGDSWGISGTYRPITN